MNITNLINQNNPVYVICCKIKFTNQKDTLFTVIFIFL